MIANIVGKRSVAAILPRRLVTLGKMVLHKCNWSPEITCETRNKRLDMRFEPAFSLLQVA